MATRCSHDDAYRSSCRKNFCQEQKIHAGLSLFSFSTPPPPHFLPFCSPSQRKPRSVFHSLHELGCDQFIVGREYNCAYFQLLSFPKRSCDTVYLCCGSNKTKQSEYYSHMLWAYFLVRVSRLKCT